MVHPAYSGRFNPRLVLVMPEDLSNYHDDTELVLWDQRVGRVQGCSGRGKGEFGTSAWFHAGPSHLGHY